MGILSLRREVDVDRSVGKEWNGLWAKRMPNWCLQTKKGALRQGYLKTKRINASRRVEWVPQCKGMVAQGALRDPRRSVGWRTQRGWRVGFAFEMCNFGHWLATEWA